MARWLKLFVLSSVLYLPGLRAWEPDHAVDVSTAPIGSPFLRHYAYDYNLDLKTLVKFEKRGFGRTEIITLALISEKTGKPMKEYGKRRIKDHVPIRTLAQEAGMDYSELHKKARQIKTEIEAKGDKNLPPPVFLDIPKNSIRTNKEGGKAPPVPTPSEEKDKDSELDETPRSDIK
jgi:hypothetical protein